MQDITIRTTFEYDDNPMLTQVVEILCILLILNRNKNSQTSPKERTLSIPKSLECYAQEFERAGRDGQPSQCFVFFKFEDRTKHLQMISSLPEEDHRSLKLIELNDVVKLCIKPECRKLQLRKYFGDM